MNIKKLTKKFFIKNYFLIFFFPHSVKRLIAPLTVKKLDQLFFNIFEKCSLSSLIECGANEATASKKIASKGIKALAIEANPQTFKNLTPKKTKFFNKINVGLSDKEDILKFYIPRVNQVSGQATFLPKDSVIYNCIEVPTITLDRLLKKTKLIQKPFALWIDVEGMQSKVLKGAKESLKNENCKIIKIEVEDYELFNGQNWFTQNIEDYLNKLNFIAIYRDFEYLYQYNIIFVKNEILPQIKQEIDLAFLEINKDISLYNCLKILMKPKNFLSEVKILVVRIFGKKIGNIIAASLGSFSSKKFLKNLL